MPMTKCGGCGKFLSSTDAVRCYKCSAYYHRACVNLPGKGAVSPLWQCPECRKNVRRDNKAETPVRGKTADEQSGDSTAVLPPTQHSSSTVESPKLHLGAASVPPALPPTVTPTPEPLPIAVLEEGSTIAAAVVEIEQEHPRIVGSTPTPTLELIMEEIRTLRAEVREFRRDGSACVSCHIRMDSIEARLDNLERQPRDLPVASSIVETVVEKLKRDLNDRDQELLANDIVIANLPESTAESPIHLVKIIATKLGVGVEERDIVSAERVGGRHINATSPTERVETRPRAIMVRLARRDLRDAMLDSARVRRGATTEDLGLSGPPRRFFVNERLTKINQQLFRAARAAAGLHGWRFVWTKRGRILARNRPGDSTHRIVSRDDIQSIIGPYEETLQSII